MKLNNRKNSIPVDKDILVTSQESSRLYTVEQFAQRQPGFTEAALRNLIFKADARHSSKGLIAGNGLIERGAIIRLGRKVLIDETKFLNWVLSQSSKAVQS